MNLKSGRYILQAICIHGYTSPYLTAHPTTDRYVERIAEDLLLKSHAQNISLSQTIQSGIDSLNKTNDAVGATLL